MMDFFRNIPKRTSETTGISRKALKRPQETVIGPAPAYKYDVRMGTPAPSLMNFPSNDVKDPGNNDS